jgi:hypothetical protein
MPMRTLTLLLLGAVACDPNVVDAVSEPPAPPDMTPVSPLKSSLIHRYSFEGEGTEAADSKFQAHGRIVGTSLSGTGSLPLAGAKSLQYVDLPDGIVSKLTDATFEAWLTWNGGQAWQRIFDFGSSAFGEDPYAPADAPAEGPTTFGGTSYLFLTPNAGPDTGRPYPTGMRVAYSRNGVGNEVVCYASEQPFPKGAEHHVAVVVDASAETIALYQDGALVKECRLTRPLSDIDDVNNWLGRSNYTVDDELDGTYDEFRIYAAALTAKEIEDSFNAGPDAKP